MKNIKKYKIEKIIIFLTLVLCVLTVASCENEIASPRNEEVAFVRFEIASARDLSSTCEPEAYGNLYWFYTAKKTDNYGHTGETGDNVFGAIVAPTTGESGVITLTKGLGSGDSGIGPFSYGSWTFTLKAYAKNETTGETTTTSKTVEYKELKNGVISTQSTTMNLSNYTEKYASGDIQVTLNSEKVSVAASVQPQGTTGYIKFDGAYLTSSEENPTLELTMTRTDRQKTYVFTNSGTDSREAGTTKIALTLESSGTESNPKKYKVSCPDGTNLETGTYSCAIKIGDKNSKETFSFAICANATTTISGEITGTTESP